MTHVRKQIRDALVETLTGLNTVKSRVFASRVHPMNDNELPCLLVYTRNESAAPITMTRPRRMERSLSVMVDACVKMAAGYDDKLDKIAVEVEKAIYNSTSLRAIAKDIVLTESEIKITGEAEKPVAVISMTFEAVYFVAENDPETLT
jgi:hypothetical protein